jgi:membrane-associated phospholipid phosphatase
MGIVLVYFAEHWVVDVLAGWLVVGVSFAIWHVVDGFRSRRSSPPSITTDAEENPRAALV